MRSAIAGPNGNLASLGRGARAGSRSDGFILTAHHGILWVGGFYMDVETKITLMDRQTFKLVCEQCGSLTVALPIEAQPDPYGTQITFVSSCKWNQIAAIVLQSATDHWF